MAARRSGPGRARLVTLTTDVGWAYAAQMKAVLLRSIPPGHVVDLAHDLPAHAIAEAAFVLRAVGEQFPPGTVHVAVVDPGVGGVRAPLIIACGDGSLLVGPDNGIMAPLARRLGRPRAFRIDPGRLTGPPRRGTTFDGRDVFAPAAARLARGVPPARLGTPGPFHDLRLPEPLRRQSGARGEVLHRDTFGNLITNVPTEWVPPTTRGVEVTFGAGRPRKLPWTRSYEEIGRGHLGVLGSSFGTVEVAVAEGRADRRCRAAPGTAVRLRWADPRHGPTTETVNSGRNLRPARR